MDKAISHLELQKKNYGKDFTSFEDNKKYYSRKVYRLFSSYAKSSGKKLLDVGCADGEFALILKKQFSMDAYGIDLTDEIELAKKKGIKAKKHNVEFKFPFNDGFFDMVVSTEVLEHIYDTDFFLSEISRVMKKKGIAIFTTPNLASLPNRLRLLFGRYPYPVPEYNARGAGHIRSYTIPVLKKQLESHGFKVIRATCANFPFPMESKRIPSFMKELAMTLGDFFPEFGSHMVVAARKE